MEILGIDVGGSGIKGAPVDTQTGKLLAPRFRLPTPVGSYPQEVAEVVAQVARNFGWNGLIGCGFPAAVRNGVVLTAANISKQWLGVNAIKLFSEFTACPVCVVNDADAAGLAEITFGAGRKKDGVIIVITIGTGLGTALFTNGTLLPNAELGHIEIDGQDAELTASDAARKREDMSWKKWGKRFNIYITRLEQLFWPNLFILGGGVSKDFDKFREYLVLETPVVPAQFLNEAGIVGAALSAHS
jgi:polyphosphate glucokinase